LTAAFSRLKKEETSMTTTTNTSGRSRKSLAEQIDRLDGILDGLSEALQGAVRDAVGGAVRETLQAVLAEVLTNPALLAVLREPTEPPTPPAPGPSQPQAEKLQGERRPGCWQRARTWLCGVARGVRRLCTRYLRWLRPALAAGGVGLLTGAVVYVAGPWLSAAATWVGGVLAALVPQGRVRSEPVLSA
jgi:hypothetical protein